tara:strand:- start:45 stop:596 length:552 start_codon:yes stop_codon:yes gene_type:complete
VQKLFENWRQYLQESKGSKYKELLSAILKGDQALRKEFALLIKKEGGWSRELANRFAEKHGNPKDDIFGDKTRHKKILPVLPKLDYQNFDDEDWNNLDPFIIHLRDRKYLPVRKKVLLAMVKYKRYWRDLTTDMARELDMLPELENTQLSYPTDTQDNGKVDKLLKSKGMGWEQLKNQVLQTK